jgi:2-polyprenyl-6-methoxyphenol hydroxylase-like FAD-dependent oxidoreductase
VIRRALIVGGGPAGLTAAIALARRAIAAEIIEAQTDWRPAGIGLLIQSPPLRAMRSLGLMDAVVGAGYAHHEVDVCTPGGDVVAVLAQMQVNEPPAPPAVALARATLHEILVAAAADAGVPVRLGTTVTDIDDRRVGLSDGETVEADLIVVADGAHSPTRALLLGAALVPQPDGQVIWRAAASRPPELTRYTMVNGPFGHLGLVPLSDALVYLWLLQTDTGAPRTPVAQRTTALRAELAGVGGHVATVLERLDDAVEIDQRSIAHLLVPPPWHRGRALLIGDAAHTTTPQLAFGVGMAIEDAVVLAELAAELDDVEALVEAFTARRYERCRFVVESSAQIAAWQTQTPPPIQDIQGLMGQAMGVLAKPY